MNGEPLIERGGPPVPAWQLPAVIGIVAAVICVVDGLAHPVHFMQAYLPAWLFFWGLTLGSMVLLMIYYLIGGAWGYLLRRILEAAMGTLPLVTLLFVPIALRINVLYPWAQPDAVAASPTLQHETFYMNRPYFFMRAVTYFVVWLVMGYLLRYWSRRQDVNNTPEVNARLSWKCNQLSAFGAVIYGLTLHFATIDWALTLMPAFHSTIWGPLFAVGQMLSALSLAVIMYAGRVDHAPLAPLASAKAVNDMGSLMFTFLVACAYMAWFQFMLIWIANMPVDIIYFLPRTSPFWLGMSWLIVILQFAVPFTLLLMRPIKRSPRRLAQVAWLLVVMNLVYMYYQIVPMYPSDVTTTGDAAVIYWWQPTPSHPLLSIIFANWMDFIAPIAIGGLWLACFYWRLDRRPLLVAGDEQLAQATYLRQLDDEEEAREEGIATDDSQPNIGAHRETLA